MVLIFLIQNSCKNIDFVSSCSCHLHILYFLLSESCSLSFWLCLSRSLCSFNFKKEQLLSFLTESSEILYCMCLWDGLARSMYLALRHFGPLSPTKKTSLLFFHFSFLYTKKIEKNYFCFIFSHPIFQLPSFFIYFRFLFFPCCFHICSCFILSTHTIRYTFCTSCFFYFARFASQFRQPAFLFDSLSLAVQRRRRHYTSTARFGLFGCTRNVS